MTPGRIFVLLILAVGGVDRNLRVRIGEQSIGDDHDIPTPEAADAARALEGGELRAEPGARSGDRRVVMVAAPFACLVPASAAQAVRHSNGLHTTTEPSGERRALACTVCATAPSAMQTRD